MKYLVMFKNKCTGTVTFVYTHTEEDANELVSALKLAPEYLIEVLTPTAIEQVN